jgi:hypothetical protein
MTHSWHEEIDAEPLFGKKNPAGQAVGELAPGGQKCPAGQSWFAQWLDVVAAETAEKVPPPETQGIGEMVPLDGQ